MKQIVAGLVAFMIIAIGAPAYAACPSAGSIVITAPDGIVGQVWIRAGAFSVQQQDVPPSGLEVGASDVSDVFDNPYHPDYRCGINTFAESLVIKTDVAAGDGRRQRLASGGDAINHL